MISARARIVARLYESPTAIAVHEFGFPDVAQTAISARLRELSRDGIVMGEKHPTKPFKVWRLVPAELTLPLTVV